MPHRETLDLTDAQQAAQDVLDGPQRFTCLVGGSRAGKTFLIVRAIVERAKEVPQSRHAILRLHANAARATITRDTLPKVIARCFPDLSVKYRQDGHHVMGNESSILVDGLDDNARVEKILGHEFVSVFLNEASQIPYESALVAFTRLAQTMPEIPQRAYVDLNPTFKSHWTNMLFGDKRDPLTLQPLADPDAYARAFLNPRDNAKNLTPEYLATLAAMPERYRRRFYEGQYADDVADALWVYETIERYRVPPEAIGEDRRNIVVVGVDPAGGGHKTSDATGIVVAALDPLGEAYVLADRSCREEPLVWARRAIAAYHEFAADCLVVETNFGGDMAPAVIRSVDACVNVKNVTATRGKAVRAAPIAIRYSTGRVHHAGRFPQLEEELCAFTLAGYMGSGSPDHADAAIWALTHLFGADHHVPPMIGYYQNELCSQPSSACLLSPLAG